VRWHGPVDPRVFHTSVVELVLDDVEEARPLGEDHDFGFRVSATSFEDADEGLRLAALRLNINVLLLDFSLLGFRGNEAVRIGELGPAHRAFVLYFYGAFNTFSSKDVFADCYYRIVQYFEADGAFVLTVDAKLEKELQGGSILIIEWDNLVLPQNSEKVSNTIAREFPVAAHLTQSKKNLEENLIANSAMATSFLL
jgi:hypothetical protein